MTRRLALVAALVIACLTVGDASARADSSQVSIMQDDGKLVDSSSATMFATLATMQSLGVETVRVNLEWSSVAPDPGSRSAPRGFDATDPDSGDYNWSAYDRLADAAPLYGITVQFNLTGPGPLWAMGAHPPTAKASTHWQPDATDFLAFADAAGERYDGTDGLARVSDWSIWNEPNQPGWLEPQWQKVGKRLVPESPQYYRRLVDSGYDGLLDSGHSTRTDTILVGETAPEGEDSGGEDTAMTPIPFLRTLYCVGANDRPLRGGAAAEVGCPTTGPASSFVRANAALFDATGYAHHPYDFFKSPSASQADPDDVPLSDIGRLERFLDTTLGAYGVHRRIPIYFTEYGYETNPPDPHQVVSPAEQAAYLNEADYLSWADPRVRSVAQFLLYDSAPNPAYTPRQYDYWDTFQTGLLLLDGTPKPALAAYRMPIWLPQTHVTAGRPLLVWGQVRPADRLGTQPVSIEWRSGGGRWRSLVTARTGTGTGYFTVHAKLPGSGYVRARWTGTVASSAAGADTDATGTFISRSVAVRVTR